jgi:5-methylcytosine-specific restriction endonuclease McrA
VTGQAPARPEELLGAELKKLARRGTTNRNARGGSDTRRARRAWLVLTYRANVDVVAIELPYGPVMVEVVAGTEGAEPACRCYRCGVLLTEDTVTVDRIKPGCRGGTYRRDNIRPACGRCNSQTGATTRSRRTAPKEAGK